MFAFSGSRSVSAAVVSRVQRVAGPLVASGAPVGVGCAPGVDAVVRCLPGFSGRVFSAQSRAPRHLVARSVALVRALASSSPVPVSVPLLPGVSASRALLVWPGCACPPVVVSSSSPSRCFCGGGSGSWATAAFAAGVGVPVFVFGVGPGALPATWAGGWASTCRFGVQSFRFIPSGSSVQQLSLFG